MNIGDVIEAVQRQVRRRLWWPLADWLQIFAVRASRRARPERYPYRCAYCGERTTMPPDGNWPSCCDDPQCDAIRTFEAEARHLYAPAAVEREGTVLTLEHLQAHLPWRMKYSREFLASTAWAHFGHASLHVAKALGHLAELVDECDHNGSDFVQINVEALRRDYAKYVADLVILAARLANVFPGGKIDLEQAVSERVAEKFGESIRARGGESIEDLK